MITDFHVFDFDGTLVDSSHRYQTRLCDDGILRIDLDHWIANEDKVMDDTPLPLCDEFRTLRESANDFVMVATARLWCGLSQKFVQVHDLASSVVARKNREDTRGGVSLKVAGISRLLNLKQFAGVKRLHVYEDNMDYMAGIFEAFPQFELVPHFCESQQGY